MALSYTYRDGCNHKTSQIGHTIVSSCPNEATFRYLKREAQRFAESHGITSPLSFDGRLRREGDTFYYSLAIRAGVQAVCYKDKRAYAFGGVA